MEKIFGKWIAEKLRSKSSSAGSGRLANSDSGSVVKCAGCENTFKKHSNKKWCSGSCYQKFRRSRRQRDLGYIKCSNCGEYFLPTTIKNTLCSESCRTENKRKYFVKLWDSKRGQRKKAKTKWSKCKHCGIDYEVTRPNRQYCSYDCRNEHKFWLRKKAPIKWSPQLREVTEKDISSSDYAEEIRAFKESGKRIIVFPSIDSTTPDVHIEGEDNEGLSADLYNFRNFKQGEK